MKIELHILQNFAPSCVNRDDNNSPKDCDFGGVRRARISSQCLKQAIRQYFGQNDLQEKGMRTKRLKQKLEITLKDTLIGATEQDTLAAIDLFIEAYYSKLDTNRPDETAVLLFLSTAEITAATDCIKDLWEGELKPLVLERKEFREAEVRRKEAESAQKKAGDNTAQQSKRPAGGRRQSNEDKKPPALKARPEVEKTLKAALTADIALFGRMLAGKTDKNVDAACQVAHALSTHRVDLDFDFYSAVDDLNTSEQTGAGMLGIQGFNSPCFYRYALVDREQLAANLGRNSDVEEVIKHFLIASVKAIPNAKQNSMSSQTLPSFGMFVVRSGGSPVSLANAFARPVDVRDDDSPDLIGKSVMALTQYWEKINNVYGSDGIVATSFFVLDGEDHLLDKNAKSKVDWSKPLSVNDAILATIAALKPGREPAGKDSQVGG